MCWHFSVAYSSPCQDYGRAGRNTAPQVPPGSRRRSISWLGNTPTSIYDLWREWGRWSDVHRFSHAAAANPYKTTPTASVGVLRLAMSMPHLAVDLGEHLVQLNAVFGYEGFLLRQCRVLPANFKRYLLEYLLRNRSRLGLK